MLTLRMRSTRRRSTAARTDRVLLAGVDVGANAVVAFQAPALPAKNTAPCNVEAPGLVTISINPAPYGGQRYSAENRSGFTRIEAMEAFGGITDAPWNPSIVMTAEVGSPPDCEANACNCRRKSSGSSASCLIICESSTTVPEPLSASRATGLSAVTSTSADTDATASLISRCSAVV